MCGIAGFTIKRPDKMTQAQAERLVDALLIAIEPRGQDATGIVALSDTSPPVWQKASCRASTFVQHRRPMPADVRTVILHTRLATQGPPEFPENNHPLRRGSFYIVHNGHLWNDRDLFRETKRKRAGEVDSEAIAAVLADAGALSKLSEVMARLEGAAAVAAVDEALPGHLAIARGEYSPLYWAETKNIVLFASTAEAIRNAHASAIGNPPKTRCMLEGEARFWNPDARPRTETFSVGWSYITAWNKKQTTTTVSQSSPKPLAPVTNDNGWRREPLSTTAQRMIEKAAGSYVSGPPANILDECGMCGEPVDPHDATTPETYPGEWPFHPECADEFDDAALATQLGR